MKKRNLIISAATLLALGGLAVGAATLPAKTAKEADAVITAEHYVPVNTTNFWSDQYNIGNQISQGSDTFFDPGRFFGTSRPLINTINLNEGTTGEIRSDDFNQTGEYVSFVMGGNPQRNPDDSNHPRNFINVWSTDKGANIEEFICNDDFSDPNISCNMVFKYVQIPEQYRGKCLIYIHDGTTGSFGGVTFGDLRINQTWDEVVEAFSAHVAGYKLSCTNEVNTNAYNAVMNVYNNSSYYAALRTAVAAKTSADDNFEKQNGLMNWAFDRTNSSALINAETIISDATVKQDGYFSVGMPFNKTGTYFVNADSSGIGEDQKYRIVSSEFTLSGSGFISAKLGGGTAVLQLLNSNYEVVASSATAAAEGTNILRPGFQGEANQSETFNLAESGVRLSTMSRVYLDCSAYLGQRVRVALADARTGGNWGLAFFDDVKTYYATAPSFSVDVAEQAGHYLTLPDEYVGSNTTDFGKAHAFWRSYLDTVRGGKLGSNYCSILTSDDIKALVASYNALPAASKTIVCDSVDYERVGSGTWYDINPTIYGPAHQYNIANSLAYFAQANGLSLSGLALNNIVGTESTSMMFVVAIMFAALASCIGFLVFKRKRRHN